MRTAAPLFLGEHNWTAFSAAQSDAESRIRTIFSIDVNDRWEARGRSHLITIAVTANGFLRYMVRSIAGTLLSVGRGEIDGATVERALTVGNKDLAGDTAPAKGTTLQHVWYG